MEPTSIIQSYESALTLLISSLNLLFIIFFFITTRNYSVSVSKYEKKSIQFRELIFEPNQKRLEAFYQKIQSTIKDSLKIIRIQIDNGNDIEEEVQSLIRNFNLNRKDLRENLGDSIYAFDEEFGSKFYSLIDEFQDKITPPLSEINSNKKTTYKDYDTIIRSNKIKMFKFLHNYEPFDLENELKFKFSDPIFIVFMITISIFMLLVFA